MPNANEELGGKEQCRNGSEPDQVAQAGFQPEWIAVTQRVNGCYCASARCGDSGGFNESWSRPMKTAERRTKRAHASGRTRWLGRSR